MRDSNAASALSNSSASVSSSSQTTFFGCTSLETTNQPYDLDCNFGPAMKVNGYLKTMTVTASSSFNMLTMARSSFFLEFNLV